MIETRTVAARSLAGSRSRGFVRVVGAAVTDPRAWAVALAGFLVRGGILLFVLPILILPSPTGLATAFGGDIIAVALATPTAGVVRLVVVVTVLVVVWLVFASLVGAAADVALARWGAAAQDDAAGRPELGRVARLGLIGRVAVVRLACQLGLAVAAAWAVARIVAAVYQQYISPGDLAIPLPIRVARSVPDAIILLLVAWLIGETVGGLAARRIVLKGRPMGRAIAGAISSLVLRPVSTFVALASTVVVLAILVAPPLAAAATVWARLGYDLRSGAGPAVVLPETLAFAALWLGALLATGLAAAIRSAVWTWHVVGDRPVAGLEPAERAAGVAPGRGA
jgi:hypothetical protein